MATISLSGPALHSDLPSMRTLVSLGAKAKKVGGLYLSLNGVAVRPTDSVDAKKEYVLVAMDGSSSGDVTPVKPE